MTEAMTRAREVLAQHCMPGDHVLIGRDEAIRAMLAFAALSRPPSVEKEAIARVIYDLDPIRITIEPFVLSFDEVAAQTRWTEPARSYKIADAILALIAGEGR